MKHFSKSFVPVRSINSAGVPVASTRPGVHRDDPVPLLRFVHVSGGNDNTHTGAACTNIVNERPKLPPGERIDAGGGLIENEKIRFVDQRAAEPHLLFHSARELAGGTFGKRAKSGGIEQFLNFDRTLLGR